MIEKRMKKLVLIAAAWLSVGHAAAQYNISGQIAHHGGRVLLLVADASGRCDTLSNSISADGTFRFTGMVSHPIAAEIEAVGTRLHIPVFIEDGKHYEVTADTQRPIFYKIQGGGDLQKQRNEFHAQELRVEAMRDSVRNIWKKDYAPDDYFGQLQLRGMMEKIDDRYDIIENDFLSRHDNLVSADIVARRIKTLIRRKTLPAKYALLGENARRSVRGQWIKPYAEKIARIIPGGIAPDLRMVTPQGDSLFLSDIKARVKILDFWASWCGPCRAENPNLKRIYEKYRSRGLEIVGISLDDKPGPWQKAIETDNLPWKHMSDLKGWNSIVCDIYEIHGIPHLFILDEHNRILAERLRGKELEEFIAKLLDDNKDRE